MLKFNILIVLVSLQYENILLIFETGSEIFIIIESICTFLNIFSQVVIFPSLNSIYIIFSSLYKLYTFLVFVLFILFIYIKSGNIKYSSDKILNTPVLLKNNVISLFL